MREDENKRTSKTEEKSLSVQLKRLMRKRWLAPALYLIVAAGILSAVFILNGQQDSTNPNQDGEVEVNDPNLAVLVKHVSHYLVDVRSAQDRLISI